MLFTEWNIEDEIATRVEEETEDLKKEYERYKVQAEKYKVQAERNTEQTICRMYKKELSLDDIADIVGCTISKVRAVLEQSGYAVN